MPSRNRKRIGENPSRMRAIYDIIRKGLAFSGRRAVYLEFSCPLELLHFELTRDDQGKVRAYLSLNNLAVRRVLRIEGDVLWTDSMTGEQLRVPFIADELRTAPRGRFKLQLSTNQLPGADRVDMTFRRVAFDGDADNIWEQDPDGLREIEPPPAPSGRELNKLVAIAGDDAENFPLRAAGHWFCVCGRANPPDDEKCVRCGRDQQTVFETLTRNAVLEADPPAPPDRPAREPEIPTFLNRPDDLGNEPASAEPSPSEEMALLRHRLVAQRGPLVRRTVFILSALILALLLIYAFQWLGEQKQRALEIHPPVRIQQTIAPRPTVQSIFNDV